MPVTVTGGDATYPEYDEIETTVRQVSPNVHWIAGVEMAEEMGNARVANIITLGFLSTYMDVPATVWKQAIARRVPQRFVELNHRAWEAGRKLKEAIHA